MFPVTKWWVSVGLKRECSKGRRDYDEFPIFVFKFEQSSYLFSHKNSRPCRDLIPGPPRYQADMLPIELSWLGFFNTVEDLCIFYRIELLELFEFLFPSQDKKCPCGSFKLFLLLMTLGLSLACLLSERSQSHHLDFRVHLHLGIMW